MTQAFFVRLLEKKILKHADPSRGRFRSFLLTSLKNFAVNEHERNMALKRGGAVQLWSLDFESAETHYRQEPADFDTPERTFDRHWADALLERALTQLRARNTERGRTEQFEQLKPYLMGDAVPVTYSEVAARLGTSEGAVKVAVHRLRREYAQAVREEIAHTVSSPDEVEEELQHLWSAVSRPDAPDERLAQRRDRQRR